MQSGEPLGAWLATIAHLEAASITSFERLAEDLTRHGAPRSLVVRARKAARDEVRHARVTARLARQRGARVPRVTVRSVKRPSLSRLAIDNAVEGCVSETFGALVATWQAQHARVPAIRETMARIATDETRHAALAWAIDAWVSRHLSPRERARVERARAAAASELLCTVTLAEPAPVTERDAGVPSAHVARRLCEAFQQVAPEMRRSPRG